MSTYKVKLFNSNTAWSCTKDSTYIKLVGAEKKSERVEFKWLESLKCILSKGSSCDVPYDASIGDLVLIELDKQYIISNDSWLPAKVEVKSPDGKKYSFPIYRWIIDSKEHCFREGKALKVFEDSSQFGKICRDEELKQRAKQYRWDEYEEGLPHCLKVDDIHSLPGEVRYSFTRDMELAFLTVTNLLLDTLKGAANCQEKWKSMDEIRWTFSFRPSEISEKISQIWKDDWFFGYQFLNGLNPMMIKRCSELPPNFPVTDEMVRLYGQRSLADEIKNGNMFLCDYKILDGVETNTINGKRQYLMAPLVLLQKTPDDRLMPIAIQLKQKPAEDNPIFFPTDSEYDWLLAKIFVRSADANVHELDYHLLRTHLLAEVFAVSLLRNVPMVHPLYKLLIPHTRYTLQINNLARKKLISVDGVFTKFAASGGDGTLTILEKALSSLTYSSLCIHEDITDRGLDSMRNFYYRDDGRRHWDIIHSFVKGVLGYYYKNDDDVQKDTELQKWIRDIFKKGFLSKESTDIPWKFTTVDELIKFVTMVIFTCSVQHAAVNSGQYDFGGWMPNNPLTLQLPPPTKKGEATEATMLNTLPDVNATVNAMDTLYMLSQQSKDFVRLGQYPEDHFTEETPLKLIKVFQRALEDLSDNIEERNKKLELPYTYLDPKLVENSVSI